MSDYEVTIRVRNGRLMRAIRDAGYTSVQRFCREHGIKNYSWVIALIGMRARARRRNGEWKPIVMDLSSALHVEPEELFTERQAEGMRGGNSRTIAVAEHQIEALMGSDIKQIAAPESMDAPIIQRELLAKWLPTLSPREERVLRCRFGFDGEEQTLDEIARDMDITKERVHQIEMKALRRLKGKARAEESRAFFSPGALVEWDS